MRLDTHPARDLLCRLANLAYTCRNLGEINAAMAEAYEAGRRELVLKYDQAVDARLETSEKYLALADKYAAALGRITYLEESLKREQQFSAKLVLKFGPITEPL